MTPFSFLLANRLTLSRWKDALPTTFGLLIKDVSESYLSKKIKCTVRASVILLPGNHLYPRLKAWQL